MNEISPVYDLVTIVFALAMGVLLCVLYETFKAVRSSFPIGSVAIFVLDILFCAARARQAWHYGASLSYAYYECIEHTHLLLWARLGVIRER